MAYTSALMGLKVWNSPSDVFSYVELVDNWTAIEAHNHNGTNSQALAANAVGTTQLQPASVTNTKLAANAVQTAAVQDAQITEPKFATGASGPIKGTFSAYRNAALSLSTLVPIVFDTIEFDVSSWFNTTTGRYTPQVPGYYHLNWGVNSNLSMTVGAYFGGILRKNGANYRNGGIVSYTANTAYSVGNSIAVANGTTDYFEIYLTHGNAGNLPLQTGSNATFFQGRLIGRS